VISEWWKALEAARMSMEIKRFDVERYRERLRKMDENQLLREGQAAKYMCSPDARYTKEPRV
jgi:hypothetical protein